MKKLLVIAILMLALVFTVVACNDEPVVDETTADTTVAENPTAEPTDEPTAEPTDEPTAEPTDEPTAEPTDEPTAEPTDEPTAEPTDEPTDEPTEPETTDPSAPVLVLNPEDLNTLAGAGTPNVNQLGSSEVITEGNNTFVRWTAAGGDPYVAIVPLGSSYTLPQYMAMRYRTNSAVEGQFFVGSGAGWSGNGDSFMVNWEEGDWGFIIVDLTQTGVTSITDGLIAYARMDFFAGDSAEGDYFDIAYVGVFNTAEDALKYDFEKYPPYIDAEDPAAGKVAHAFDTFYVNGGMYFPEDGGAGDKLTAQNNTVTFGVGEAHDSMTLRGWVGFNQPMAALGYFVDGYSMVYGDFFAATGDDVKAVGGEHASRFEITVPLGNMTAGFHTVGFVAKLEDGTVVRLRENLTVVIIPFTADEEIVLAARAGGSTPIVPAGQTLGQRFTVNGYLKQIAVADMATYSDGNTNTWNLKVWAWDTDYATTVAAEPLYSVDGENHNDNKTLDVMIPIEKMITGDVYYEVTYLSGSGGFTGWNAQGAVVEGLETYIGGTISDVHFASSILIGVETDPNAIKMDSHNFQSTAAGNYTDADVDFQQTDLTGCFNVTYGQGNDNHCFVKNGDNGPYFWMGVFNSIHTSANGAYVFSVEDVAVVNPGFASIVVRANLAANPEGKLYGSDGNDGTGSSHGGSGIYLSMDGSNLIINVKGYADGAYLSNKFTVAVDSNDIKIADDGEKVYVLAGETPVATIVISGTKDFGIANVPADALAETVVITLSDGTTQTIENAVVASRHNNGALGVATRGGGQITFTAISLMPFDSIEIPDAEPEEPVVPDVPTVENLAIPQDQWVVTGHRPGIQDSSDGMVAAGGVESGALLHQGSIALGNIDLSKYSKVVIMWGCDNSDVTVGHYNASANNRIMLVSAEVNGTAPADGTIIAGGTYVLGGWAVQAFEIDLTGVDYNGPVYLCIDTLPGTFALFSSVEFIGGEIDNDTEEPVVPEGPKVIGAQAAGSTVKHISQDGFRYLDGEMNVVAEIVTPGQYGQFDGTLEYTKGGHPCVADFGWVAMNCETFQFGYIINDGEPIMNDTYATPASDPVKEAAASVGASNCSGFYGVLIVGFLPTGEHNIKFVMQQDGGDYVIIREYTVIVSE